MRPTKLIPHVLRTIRRLISDRDIFISYSRADGRRYASAITNHFLDKGYDCYFDQYDSTHLGTSLPQAIKNAIAGSSAFVLIGSEGAALSAAVEEEVAVFVEKNGGKRPIIPISINGAINSGANWYKFISGVPLIDDTALNLREGLPSAEVLRDIASALATRSKRKRLRRIFICTLWGALVITGYSLWMSIRAVQAVRVKDQAIVEASLLKGRIRAALNAIDSINALKTVAIEQKESAEGKLDSLQHKEYREEEKVANLTTQSDMLFNRAMAMNRLNDDPEASYRLEAEAHKRYPVVYDNELIRQTISRIGFYYKSALWGYHIEDMKGPFILLSQLLKRTRAFYVFNIHTGKMIGIKVTAFRAWLIPTGQSWNILTESDPFNHEHQLYNDKGIALGEKVRRLSIRDLSFISNTKVRFYTNRPVMLLTWDLVSGRQQLEQLSTSNNIYLQTEFDQLACRHDGTSGGVYHAISFQQDGLVLTDIDGRPDKKSYIPVGGWKDLEGCNAIWSEDDQVMAVNDTGHQRMGFWKPAHRYFVWAGLDNFLTDKYVWGKQSHWVALAGSTGDQHDISVMIIDAEFPDDRKVIFRGRSPVRSMAFLPGDRILGICDEDGIIYFIDVGSGKLVGKGYHPFVFRLYSTKDAFCSMSTYDLRIWSVSPAPSTQWVFTSTGDRRYRGYAAADPMSRWMAVPFTSAGKDADVEIRDMVSGERFDLAGPDTNCINIKFSPDGRWLALETYQSLRIWRTDTWRCFDLGLISGDRQFWSLRFSGDTLFAHTLGAGEYEHQLLLHDSVPHFIRRVNARKDNENRYTETRNGMFYFIKGWGMADIRAYKTDELTIAPEYGWITRFKCRNQSDEEPCDCDVQFIPNDVDKIMPMYDKLLWKPTAGQWKMLTSRAY